MSILSKKEESNPFFCDDEEEDEWTGGSGRNNKSKKNQFDDDNDQLQQLRARIDATEDRSLESLNTTRRALAETEEIGNNTAEELDHQGQQLNNAEEKLDSITKMTKVTQRNINSIKSVFGGIKNWFQQKNEGASGQPSEVQHSRLRDTINETTKPSLSASSSSSSRIKLSHPHKASRLYNQDSDGEEEREDNFRDISRTSSKQAMIDEHLGEIGAGVSRLKELSLGMNEELKRQDEQLGRLMVKTDASSDVIQKQNKQMRGLLS